MNQQNPLNPSLYEQNHLGQFISITEALEKYRSWLGWGPNETLLDIGCGPGDTLTFIVNHVAPPDAKLVGGDISKEVLKYAQKNYSHNRITYKEIDIQSPKLFQTWKNEEFTKAFAFYSLICCENLSVALDNVYKLLKPGGRFLTIQPATGLFPEVFEVLAKMDKWKIYYKDLYAECNIFTPSYKNFFEKLLRDAGFTEIKSEIETKIHSFSTFDDYYNAMISIDFYYWNIPDELKAAHKADTEKVLKAWDKCLIHSNKIFIKSVLCVAVARKPS